MLAPCDLPERFVAWNRKWKAPSATQWSRRLPLRARVRLARLIGPFGFQPNNSTRQFEYPWAFHAAPLRPGMRALEIGGGLSGFQFAVAQMGLEYVNIDPLVDYGATEKYGAHVVTLFDELNRALGTHVSLKQQSLKDGDFEPETFDVIYSISTLEHLSPQDRRQTMAAVGQVLKPNGFFVCTVDLFVNLLPFTRRESNRWGTNVSIASLIADSGLMLAHGDRSELFGYPEFDTDRVLSKLDEYFIGSPYPSLVQAFVLRKTPQLS